MRSLKFRVWSEEDREYRTDCNLTELFNSVTGTPATIYSDEGDHFDIEQYTGLKDKNGKEIYEGDVVSVCHSDMLSDHNKFFDDKSLVKCSLDKGGAFVVRNWYGERILNYDIPLRFVEVIGNIHENPELVGGKE